MLKYPNGPVIGVIIHQITRLRISAKQSTFYVPPPPKKKKIKRKKSSGRTWRDVHRNGLSPIPVNRWSGIVGSRRRTEAKRPSDGCKTKLPIATGLLPTTIAPYVRSVHGLSASRTNAKKREGLAMHVDSCMTVPFKKLRFTSTETGTAHGTAALGSRRCAAFFL